MRRAVRPLAGLVLLLGGCTCAAPTASDRPDDVVHEDDSDDWPLAHAPPTGPDGPYEATTPTGERLTGQFFQGARHGTWSAFNPAGVLVAKGSFDLGELRGAAWTYYDDGAIKEFGHYDGGQAVGPWMVSWPDGSSFAELEQLDGEPHGSFSVFFPGNRIADRRTYEHGKQVGVEQNYGPDGRLIAEGFFVADRPAPPWRCHDESGVRELPAPTARITPREACGFGPGPESPEDFERFGGVAPAVSR